MADTTNPDNVLARITQLSVEPFRALLAHYLQIQPTLEALQDFANKYPDRFAQGLQMLANMSGYRKEMPAIQNNFFIQVQSMSDSELRQIKEKQDQELRELMEKNTVEGEVESV